MAVSQPVASVMTVLVSAAVVAVLLATTGQTVVAERQVLARIDDAGTRSIEVGLDPAAGATANAVDRVSRLGTVEWAVGFGTVVDVHNEAVRGGAPVALRPMYGELPPAFRLEPPTGPPIDGVAWAGPIALATLGLADGFGGVADGEGATGYAVVGRLTSTDPLADFNRQAITPAEASSDAPLRRLTVVTTTPGAVGPTVDHVLALLDIEDPSAVTVQTSERLAAIRSAVAGELGRFGRDLVLQALAAALVVVLVVTYGATATRRRDFGRRRALGATRGAITALVVFQQAATAAIGAVVGLGAGTLISLRLTASPPDWEFAAAVAVLTVLVAIAAAVVPAVIAAMRDPVSILRVP
jgi:putative ABC transport system permease protein